MSYMTNATAAQDGGLVLRFAAAAANEGIASPMAFASTNAMAIIGASTDIQSAYEYASMANKELASAANAELEAVRAAWEEAQAIHAKKIAAIIPAGENPSGVTDKMILAAVASVRAKM